MESSFTPPSFRDILVKSCLAQCEAELKEAGISDLQTLASNPHLLSEKYLVDNTPLTEEQRLRLRDGVLGLLITVRIWCIVTASCARAHTHTRTHTHRWFLYLGRNAAVFTLSLSNVVRSKAAGARTCALVAGRSRWTGVK
jgi:hypothetical protein